MKKTVVGTIVATLVTSTALAWTAAPADAGAKGLVGQGPISTSRARTSGPTQQWSAWTPAPFPPSIAIGGLCTEDVTATFPVNSEEQRTRLIPGGNLEQEVRGPLVIELTPSSQPDNHYRFDVHGASLGNHSNIYYLNGDVLVRGVGPGIVNFNGNSAQGTGLPRFAYYRSGAVADLFSPKYDTAAIIQRPRGIVDLCAYMGLNSVPVPPFTS